MRALVVAVAGLTIGGGCKGKAKQAMPVAADWSAPGIPAPGVIPGPGAGGGMAGGRVDPHAGVPGAPPLTEEQIQGGSMPGTNPHAGVPGAPPLGAAAATGAEVGTAAPAADRVIDSTKVLGGTVLVPAANQARIPAGAVIFLSVRAADAGAQAGVSPMAVARMVATGTWPLRFRITEAQAMVGGTPFAGTVVISARYDQDGEARSQQPGDISGTTTATIPADGLVIVLDTVQP